MKTIIAGSRKGVNLNVFLAAIRCIDWPITEVVSGGAAGVDAQGEAWAAENEIPVKRFPADWRKHGRSAGPIRNTEMAQYAEALLAIWDGESPGTRNMIETAKRMKLRVLVWMNPPKGGLSAENAMEG